MIAAAAGTATAQVQLAQPIQTGEPVMTVRGEALNVRSAAMPSMSAGLDGTSYGVTHIVGDELAAQQLNVATATFNSAGQAAQFTLNFAGIEGGRNFFYNDTDAAWADTTVVSPIVVAATDLADGFDGMLNMDSDQDVAPGERILTFRSWFNSDGASVRPFAQPSDDVAAFERLYTPTILGTNDGLPEDIRHPTALGFNIGLTNGPGIAPPAGRAWVDSPAALALELTWLGFRNIDGAFVGVNFDVAADDLVDFDGSGNMTIDGLIITPADTEINLDSGLPDLSLGFAPIAWGDGITDGFLIYALQIEVIVQDEADGGAACPFDVADGFGFPGADGTVDFGDFLAALSLLGPCVAGDCTILDIADGFGFPGADGTVDFGDFLAALSILGPCP